MKKLSYFPYVTRHNTNRNTTSIASFTQQTYVNTPRLKNTIFKLTITATQQTFPQTPHSHYNIHKTNMCHIHTSIVSRSLAARCNNKILCPSPLPISSSEGLFPVSLVTPLSNSEQINHPSSKESPLCPLCNTHIMSSTAPMYTIHGHPWICGQTRRSECTAAQKDREADWWTTSSKIRIQPLAKVMGVGRQQQQDHL